MASYVLGLFIFLITAFLIAGIIILIVRDLIKKAENNAIAGAELLAQQFAPLGDLANPQTALKIDAFQACIGIQCFPII